MIIDNPNESDLSRPGTLPEARMLLWKQKTQFETAPE
jgi:hypothetical protein